MSINEMRVCPKGHVEYEIIPFTFSGTGVPLHNDKHYCPVCGEKLKVLPGMEEFNNVSYTEKGIERGE